MTLKRFLASPYARSAVFAACLIPLVWLAWRAINDDLGANPIEAIIRNLGDWALRFLLIGLSITPLRLAFNWGFLAIYRRMIGLYAFSYVTLHLLGYVVLDQYFDWARIWADIVKRPYITIGMLAFVLLVPLAATSPKAMVKRLGGPAWQKLHRLVYLAAIGGVIHYLLLVKADIREPLTYIAILIALLGSRLVLKRRSVTAAPA